MFSDFNINSIGKVVGAKRVSGPLNHRKVCHIATDSRSVVVPDSTLFAAVRTNVGDGHRYISSLYESGVRMFLVEEMPEHPQEDATFVVVDSVSDALRDIARECLRNFDNGVIVTGSVGKTKVKELIYEALVPYTEVRRSPRSWNSRIGIPLGVWFNTASGNPEWLITEVGIDGPGQAAYAHDILAGSHRIGVITPLTEEHDGEFPSHADKIREKLAILADCSTIVYADSDAELSAELEKMKALRPGLKTVAVVQGSHPTVFHALAASVIAETGIEGVDVDSVPLVDSRREIRKGIFGNTVIADFFTPDCNTLWNESLNFFRRQVNTMKDSVLVLGHMLGDDKGYRQAISEAAMYGVETVYCLDEACRERQPEGYGETKPVVMTREEFLEQYSAGKLLRDSNILLFGFDREFAGALSGAGHDTVLEVNLDAVIHNYNHYRRLLPAGTGMVGMVKASAYGMGAVEIGRTLQSQGAAYLAVAVIDEAIELRNNGITMPVMVLNPVTNQIPALFSYNIEPAVFSIGELQLLIEAAEKEGVASFPVHIKLDTGMHRVGFIESQLDELIELLNKRNAVRVESVFSHLATADCLDKDDYTQKQLDAFYGMTATLEKGLGYKFRRHILNTAGMMRFADCGPYEMARLGIGLYGVSPLPERCHDLQTVATFKSRIISLKHWPAGTPIGYGCRGVTDRDGIIATVPVGYADGLNRGLSRGNACFDVKGVKCPTVGSICMDLCMIDVSDVPDVAVGDAVEVFGENNPVEVLAEKLGTIPYELFTWVSPRVKRIYFRR